MSRADRRHRDLLPDGPLAATIAAVRPDGTVMVLIPDLDGGDERHGPCYGLAPRPDDVEPQRDDPCCVLEDSSGRMWIAAWHPNQ